MAFEEKSLLKLVFVTKFKYLKNSFSNFVHFKDINVKNNKKIAMVSVVLTTLFLLNGCNTVKGFGKDVSKTGQEIQKASR